MWPDERRTAIKQAPRYEQLANELRNAILDGQFDHGMEFPTESALCERYRVSRFTVREALRCLQEERLISRRQGSGTQVEPPATRRHVPVESLADHDELLRHANEAHAALEPAGQIQLPRSLLALVESGRTDPLPEFPAGKWAHLHGVRRTAEGEEDSVARTVTELWIRPDLAGHVEALDFGAGSLFRQLETLGGFTLGRVHQKIAAVPASAAMARALKIPRRSPCLSIVRIYHDSNGVPFEITRTSHPGDAFTYSTVIAPETHTPGSSA